MEDRVAPSVAAVVALAVSIEGARPFGVQGRTNRLRHGGDHGHRCADVRVDLGPRRRELLFKAGAAK